MARSPEPSNPIVFLRSIRAIPLPAEAHASVSSFQVAILSHTPTACSRKDGLVGRLVLIAFIRLLLREVPQTFTNSPETGLEEINDDHLEADFWPVSASVPGHTVRISPTLSHCADVSPAITC